MCARARGRACVPACARTRLLVLAFSSTISSCNLKSSDARRIEFYVVWDAPVNGAWELLSTQQDVGPLWLVAVLAGRENF